MWPASGEDAWFDAADHDRIDIIPDKTEYQPGERARCFYLTKPYLNYPATWGNGTLVAAVGMLAENSAIGRLRAMRAGIALDPTWNSAPGRG